eukprot:6173654-Pleurochrysis_carterae.AAC.3
MQIAESVSTALRVRMLMTMRTISRLVTAKVRHLCMIEIEKTRHLDCDILRFIEGRVQASGLGVVTTLIAVAMPVFSMLPLGLSLLLLPRAAAYVHNARLAVRSPTSARSAASVTPTRLPSSPTMDAENDFGLALGQNCFPPVPTLASSNAGGCYMLPCIDDHPARRSALAYQPNTMRCIVMSSPCHFVAHGQLKHVALIHLHFRHCVLPSLLFSQTAGFCDRRFTAAR